jgi:hypothetical protein
MSPAHRLLVSRMRQASRSGLAFTALAPVVPAAILAGLLLTGLLLAGCGSDTAGPAAAGPIGRLVDLSGCKSGDLFGAGGAPVVQDCIGYSYRLGTLDLKHINAGFNCCPEIDASVTVSGDTVLIVEEELVGGCHCLCLYDLRYEIHGLALGVYRVIVAEECLLETDVPLEFTMDLRASTTGLYCVSRDHYPWIE